MNLRAHTHMHTHTLNTSPVRLSVWITPPPRTETPLFYRDLLMLSLALTNKMDDHRSAVGRGVCGQHRPGLSTLQREAVISPWSKTSPHYTQTLTSSVIGDTTWLVWRRCKKATFIKHCCWQAQAPRSNSAVVSRAERRSQYSQRDKSTATCHWGLVNWTMKHLIEWLVIMKRSPLLRKQSCFPHFLFSLRFSEITARAWHSTWLIIWLQ